SLPSTLSLHDALPIFALIDCDSFEITDGKTVFPCMVGVPTYTPPELQGQSFQGVRRTKQHDAFGLAVLIFHMLFLGRHPFAGIRSEEHTSELQSLRHL